MSKNQGYDIVHEVLPAIDPAALDYEQWLQVGMALKADGYSCDVWDSWSMRDLSRYHRGECPRKWAGFNGSGVTCGTLVQIARDHGWEPDPGREPSHGWEPNLGREPSHGREPNLGWEPSHGRGPDSGWEPNFGRPQ